ncbi:MAG TPA: hypothetical protein VKU00_33225 [Chthonomonadaceae bacterium]|nr:hypothetical protein [Chthonomonadaceae bacterium]
MALQTPSPFSDSERIPMRLHTATTDRPEQKPTRRSFSTVLAECYGKIREIDIRLVNLIGGAALFIGDVPRFSYPA